MDIKQFQKIPCFYRSKFDWIFIFKIYGFTKISEMRPGGGGLRQFMIVFKKYDILTPLDMVGRYDTKIRAPETSFGDSKVNAERLRKNVFH
jgi:hypothetical protein